MTNENNEIKSALEIALERAEKIEISKEMKEGFKREEYKEKGKRIASKYLNDPNFNPKDFNNAINEYKESTKKWEWTKKGALSTLFVNLTLPISEDDEKTNSRVMEGILELTHKNKERAKTSLERVKGFFSSYKNEREQAYDRLKAEFELKLTPKIKKLEKLGVNVIGINVEESPQFQEEWGRIYSNLDSTYNPLLENSKTELKKLVK